ncbi:response regulator transcription factor [Nonomuraea soli]|uniref:DNA-binding NarL/FixJ family response regulator n=1 Tax=Nonomuraea soli TaxID=1032476 RepID=A0A7W0HMW3_9ACTN|nr:response regulator transcription factor [Nonomuraea soli]MBA2888866.1 DNA-binding NarL/FixJ family response regulator [Nonomuraea soli]
MNIRVVIVDDYPLYVTGVKTALSDISDIEVIGDADTVTATVELCRDNPPDIVLVDLELHSDPGAGVDLIGRLSAELPHTRFVVLSQYRERSRIAAAVTAGACGFLHKESSRSVLVQAIRAVAEGIHVLDPSLGDHFREAFGQPPRPFPELSDRLHQVLELLAAGYGYSRIADTLHLAPGTVRNLVTQLVHALGVRNKEEAVVQARERGLGTHLQV